MNIKFVNSMIFNIIVYNKTASTFYFILLVLSHVTDSTIVQVNAENINNDTENTAFNLAFNKLDHQINQSNNTKVQSNESLGSQHECPEEIEVDETSFQYKKENLECVVRIINTCSIDDIYLLYATGSLYLKILGLKNASCRIDVLHEIERDSNSYTCVIPISRLSMWDSWKNGNGLEALGNVINYCSQK